MYVYIFVHTRFMGPREEVRSMLESIEAIDGVYPLFDNSFLLRSEEHANTIAREIRTIYPNRRFLLSRISDQRQGWLPRRIWNFIREDED